MRAVEALETLELLGSTQWGVVTTAQARAAGVSNVQLARLANDGTLSRVRHGVYALPSASTGPLQDLRAAWLAASGPDTPDERGVVVSGVSAAAVHELGDLVPSRHEFSSTKRRQSSQPDVQFRRARLSRDEVTVVDGLPVTTVERTVTDLTSRGVDADHLATVLEDAVTSTRSTPSALASALERHAHQYLADNGADLLVQLAPAKVNYWAASLAKTLTDTLTVQLTRDLQKSLATSLSGNVSPRAFEEAVTRAAFHTLARTA